MRGLRGEGKLLLLLILFAIPLIDVDNRGSYVYVVTYTLENRGERPYKLGMEDRSIPLFWSSRYQRVKVLNSTHRLVRKYTDEDGNLLALLDLPEEIPPGSTLTYSAAYLIEIEARPKPHINLEEAGGLEDIPERLVEEFCISTETFTIDGEIESLANKITENQTTVLGMVLALIGWIRENIYYASHEVPRHPKETLKWGVGDCDDQAILLITLCRALEIPAILQLGCVYLEDYERSRVVWDGHLELEQRDVGWHGWVLVYIPPWGWLPLDLTLKVGLDPLSCLVEAPEYGDFIAVCYNISRSDYVGESQGERTHVISSGIYITVQERMAVSGAPTRRRMRITFITITATFIAAAALILALRKRRETFNALRRNYPR